MWYLKNTVQERWAWKDTFNASQCQQIIDTSLQTYTPHMGMADGDAERKIRNSDIVWLKHDNPSWNWVFQYTADAVNYINNEFYQFDLDYIQDLQFTIYDSQKNHQHYGRHIDTMYNSMGQPRKLSFSILLSDPNEYEGGDLIIVDSDSATPVPKTRGRAVFFPSHLLHEVTPVTSGIRYSLVGWVSGPKFR